MTAAIASDYTELADGVWFIYGTALSFSIQDGEGTPVRTMVEVTEEVDSHGQVYYKGEDGLEYVVDYQNGTVIGYLLDEKGQRKTGVVSNGEVFAVSAK
ncbi:hypothetical protein MK805_00795 [Shimazuella sp. AN120528]|uniref:hypothetical protein n=1 Tax=Shimazuella soli TaxID=1892854 RepID=UPI001F0F43BA|nr:hypothetical protein [Shimazuella soli]MCH5583508.1 hypothetical protein [Shimazuella soli]